MVVMTAETTLRPTPRTAGPATAATSARTGGPAARPNAGQRRRSELASFLRSRRERIEPEVVGLPPGLRRRTPGLRREEVAQLAGVGVTWYTWLEQGRPINASVQVLDAVARTLKLDAAETEHLYRLADVPAVPPLSVCARLEPEVQGVLDAMSPLPAAVTNGRTDVLAWNKPYALMFPFLVDAPDDKRNVLWQTFMVPGCCHPFVNRREELGRMVATFRSRYGRHIGEPAWDEFVRRLSAASPDFAELWAEHDVADTPTRIKVFRHPGLGEVKVVSTILEIASTPGARINVYSPGDDATRAKFELLRGDSLPRGTYPCGHTFGGEAVTASSVTQLLGTADR
jgi:transcriptional regulator with XRE-family HTH domain